MKVKEFLSLMFGDKEKGYLCLATIDRSNNKKFSQEFFLLPLGLEDAIEWAEKRLNKDLYFCPLLFSTKIRSKDQALPCNRLWADLDDCDPKCLGEFGEPKPNIIVKTSPGRWQAYWLLDKFYDANILEGYNKRICRAYKLQGADQGGWDATQLLRLPTMNFKY